VAIQAELKWTEGLQFVARSSNGPAVVVDSSDGGSGATPMQLLLMGVAGCTGIDVVLILQKKRLDLKKFEIRIDAEQAESHPMRFTHVKIEYILFGKKIPEKAIQQAIKLSEEKYCSAMASMNAEFTHTYRIFEDI
jgi:putative redox protein